MLDDGHYLFEVAGLGETDADAHLYPNAKPPSRVMFSTGPITVSASRRCLAVRQRVVSALVSAVFALFVRLCVDCPEKSVICRSCGV